MKYWLCLFFLLQSTLASAVTLSDRLASFSTLDRSSGSFVETWSADYLDEPLVSKGKLAYKRPSQLSKFITHPEHIEQHINGSQLTVIHNNETHSIQLPEHPELAAGIYALQAVLDGDEKNLYQHFEIRYNELETGWSMLLTPKNRQIADSIELIIVQGKSNRIQRVTIQFHNGDSLLTEIVYGS